MLPIVLALVIGVLIIFERSWYFLTHRANTAPEIMLNLIEHGKFTDALAIAEQYKNPAVQVLATGLTHRLADPEKSMMSRGFGEIGKMKRGLPTLDTIITLGPLLGLLGTIIGMIDSFGIMATEGTWAASCRDGWGCGSFDLYRGWNLRSRCHPHSV